jgi:signal peptidase II
MRPSHSRWIWITLGAFALDRLTKYAIESLTPLGFHKPLIANFFALVHASNPGLAFGFFADAPSPRVSLLLTLATLFVCALLTWLLFAGHAGVAAGRSGVALILGGALGNLFDRALFSSVTDFFDVQFGSYHWPAFNIADTSITVGALLVAYEILFQHKHVASHEEG